ncbi:MAG: hypothetical protein WCI36_05055 [bacterium]
MKILIINHEFPQMGTEAGEASLYLLGEYSKKTDFWVDYVTVSEDDQYHFLEMGGNISIHRLPINRNKKMLEPCQKKNCPVLPGERTNFR